jgi:hypothetical protein
VAVDPNAAEELKAEVAAEAKGAGVARARPAEAARQGVALPPERRASEARAAGTRARGAGGTWRAQDAGQEDRPSNGSQAPPAQPATARRPEPGKRAAMTGPAAQSRRSPPAAATPVPGRRLRRPRRRRAVP